ncbi:MAG: conserved phage C-terminal domain-containing protein, partial [Syntrophales bacterium]
RLKDGGSLADCRKIIDTKMQDPYFQANPKYLNPRTLFRSSHWDLYLNEDPLSDDPFKGAL